MTTASALEMDPDESTAPMDSRPGDRGRSERGMGESEFVRLSLHDTLYRF